jgi:hypothetical protein
MVCKLHVCELSEAICLEGREGARIYTNIRKLCFASSTFACCLKRVVRRVSTERGIFSVPGFLLVTRSEYSQSLASYRSHVQRGLRPDRVEGGEGTLIRANRRAFARSAGSLESL